MPDRSVDAHTRSRTPGAGVGHPTLATARLTLRAPAGSDVARIVALAGNREVSHFLARVPHPYSAADARAWLAYLQQAHAREVAFALDDGTGLIGVISFRALDETPEIGYWLGREYWGKGYMSEAAPVALGWLFGATATHAVAARASTVNTASHAVLSRAGFARTGPDVAGERDQTFRLDRAAFFACMMI
ncbi:GNAT family N-acetyltransferase [Stappia stellulata]|uniref:GNAT family N-acetyltransferase n=1 Tax=Stappia stellulata TaxID=71235 RepID=UPI001CD4400D|nr:GNAT family N-acetyltransferase [Stappia stellulata]MCA1244757.1 GNAT family N-acetyltransferase [Stappia stellulata]